MAKLLICIVALATLAYVSAADSIEVQIEPVATTFAQWLVDTISQKIVALARLLNLKLRVVRFLVSLYTTENLVLLRNLIEYGVKLANFALRFLPTSAEQPEYSWIPALIQFLNIGEGGLFGLALGEPTATDTDDLIEESSEISTNPPIFFNASPITTDRPESNDINNRISRSTVKEVRYADENDPTIVAIDSKEADDILKIYEGRLMTLDKLINAKRRK